MELLLYKEEDRTYVWSLFENSMKPYVSQIWGGDEQNQQQSFEQGLTEVETRIIIHNRERVGYIQYQLAPDHIYIKMLIISSKYRGRRLGKLTLDYIETQHVGYPISLRCFKLNERAFEFYQKNNFDLLEEEEIFYLLQKNGALEVVDDGCL